MGNDKGRSFCFPAVVPALREGEPGFDVEQEFSGLGRDLRGPGDGQRHSGPAAAPRHHPEHQAGKLSAQGETQGGKRGTPGSGSGRETGRTGSLRKTTTKIGRALEKSDRLSHRGGMLSGKRDRFNPENRTNFFPLDIDAMCTLPRMVWAGGNGLMWRPAAPGKPFISMRRQQPSGNWPPSGQGPGERTRPSTTKENTPMTEEWKEIYRVLEEISEQQKILSGGLMRLLDILEKDKDSDGPSLSDTLRELVGKIDHLTGVVQRKSL